MQIYIYDDSVSCTIFFEDKKFNDISQWGFCEVDVNSYVEWNMADATDYRFTKVGRFSDSSINDSMAFARFESSAGSLML